MKKPIAIIIVLAVIIGLYLNFSGEENGVEQEIITTEISRGDITRSVATTGSVRPLVTVEVGSQLSGQIAELYADFNSPVEKDQLIALIDPQTFEKRVRQSEADLKVAQANVIVQKANISRARANLRRFALDYERIKPLVKKGTVPETDLDSSLAAYESAQADLEIAQAQLRNAEAVVEQREAALSTAVIDLDRTNIKSPINGVVINRSVDVGQTVAASLSSPVLFNIAQDLREIQLEASVDESDIGNVKEGNNVSFTVDAYPDDKFRGRVEQIRLAPVEEQNVVTYSVIISARNPDKKLLPGMTASIEIITGKRENIVRVSNDALRFKPKNAEEAGPEQAGAMFGGGQQPGGSFAGRGGGGQNQMLMSRLEPLNLDEEKQKQIQAALSESFAKMREEMFSGGSSGGSALSGMPRPPWGNNPDRSEMAQRIDNMLERVLQQYLTPEQMDLFRESSNSFRDMRRGEVWTPSKNGEPERHSVMLGISDDEYTEIMNSDLEPGTVVITRIREKKI